MDLQRINLKIYLEDWNVSSADVFKIFNTWISQTADEVLVDVADYSHVHAGPVTLLVGHEANYCIDNTDEKMGLLYARKQPLDGSLSDRLRSIFVTALKACRRLELEPDLEDRVKFRGGEALLVANDRLSASNTAEAHKILSTDLEAVLQDLYGGNFTVETTPASRPTLRIKSATAFDVSTLLKNLGVN